MSKYKNLSKGELLSLLEKKEQELKNKKHGLVWDSEREPEKVVMDCKKYIPVLKRIKNKEIVTDNSEDNLLIEGDNYHALTVLCYTHQEKINFIYIDPPYNTGNKDFIYNDKYVDEEDRFRHSKWLNFMEKRLELMKKLLKDSGVICISISDIELCNLRLLCDQVFGPNNFIACIPRRTKSSGKTSNKIVLNHDYILIYSKNADLTTLGGVSYVDKKYEHEDEYVERRGRYKLNQTLDYNSLRYSKDLDYPIEIDGEVYYPGGSYEKYLKRQNGDFKRTDWVWRWSKDLFKFGYENGFIVVKKNKNGNSRLYTKTYWKAKIGKKNGEYFIEEIDRTKAMTTLDLMDSEYSNDNAKKELKRYFNDTVFDYLKPSILLKTLLKLHTKSDGIVLDCFAGSGTLAQAVLELNKEDNGNRKFILCTNNEGSICENVTYPRVKKIMCGYKFTGKVKTQLYKHKLSFTSFYKNSEKVKKEIDNIIKNNKYLFDSFERSIKENVIYVYGVNNKSDFKEGLNGNLQYFKTKLIKNNKNQDQVKIDLINNCTDILCIKENTFLLYKESMDYKIFKNRNGEKSVSIYYNLYDGSFEDFKSELKNIEGKKIFICFH